MNKVFSMIAVSYTHLDVYKRQVKYDGITIGEFQVHKNRNCFKFRFNMQNLLNLLKNE